MDALKKTYILINSLGGGGAERQISYVGRLSDIDKIICIEPLNEYNIPDEKIIYLCDFFAGGNLFKKLYQFFYVIYKLRKLGIDKNTHLLCFLQLSHLIGTVYKLLYRCKLTLCIRTNPFGFYTHSDILKLPFFIFKFMLRKADHVLCNSLKTQKEIELRMDLQNVYTIPNGYDIRKIRQMSEKTISPFENLFETNKTIVHVGRLYYDKGQWHLIRILGAIRKKMPCKLIIIGQGPLLTKLKSLALSLDLKVHIVEEGTIPDAEADVYFFGFRQNPYRFIKNASVFAFPSIFEGLPNAIIESLITGTPVVVADCPSGPREIMCEKTDLSIVATRPEESKYGYLMPPFSGKEIFDSSPLNETEIVWQTTLTDLLCNESELDTLRKNTSDIATKFDFEKIALQWQQFITKV
jgi:glycosyltransferase involved in cell wall biosynthesis